ncbi:hypothetical protein V6N12_010400 [Hibiscus sabdariffa]|uniref:Uncharacterized protein n=1 Tax=Hibiscus sabdariffa TaxID=183260 RepID=A0ABR2EJZ8_9ROSI
MPVCSCAARLAGGGWDSGVFGAAVWQPHGGFRQFCWLHRDVQSRWQHHGDPMQFRWQHRGGPVQFRWQHRLARMPPGITGAGMMVWCASSGTPMPLLATMFVTALVVGSTLSRPVTVAGAVIGCLAWRPSLFSWCTSKLTATVFLSIACPGVAPFPWPINLVACFAEGPMGRPLPLGYVFGSTWGLLVVAKGAPLSVLGSLGVRDPGVRAGAFACAYGCFSHGRLVAAGSVSGRPGGAGRSRGCLPGLRGRPCSALAYPTLGCGSSLWPLMAACAVAARWLGTWLCPLSCLPIGYSCTGLFSRPGLVKV